jgi:hypothetical protein
MADSPTRNELYVAFQVARNALIRKMIEEGEKPEAIAKAISIGALQVWAITRIGQPAASE